MNVVKRSLQTLAVLLALLAALAGYLALTFDAARLRGELAQAVLKQTGRTLTFGDDFGLHFFPQLAVRVTEVRLSAPGDPATPFASLAQARVALAVLPLLSRRIEVERIELEGLKISLRRDATGRLNVDDLMPAAAPDHAAAPGSQPGLPRFSVAGVSVRDGEVSFEDLVRQARSSVSGVTLDIGPLANQASGSLALGATFREQDAAWSLRLNTAYRIDLDRQQVDLSGLAAGLVGELPGAAKVEAHLAAASFGALGPQWRAEAVLLDLDARRDDTRGTLHLRVPTLAADGAAATARVPAFALTAEARTNARAPLRIAVDGAFDELSAGRAQGAGTVQVNEATGRLSWTIERYAPLLGRVDLRLDRLDLDRYLALAPAPTGAGGRSPAVADAAREGAPRIDLSGLRGPELRGVVELGALTVHGLKASAVQSEFWLHKGRLDLPSVAATLYGGRLQGRASLDSHGNQIAATQTLTDVDLHPLLRDLTGKDLLEGRGEVNLELQTAGATTDEWARSLAGDASFRLRDGAIHGIDLGDWLQRLRTAFVGRQPAEQAASADQKTAFSSLSASFRIADGVAHNDDLDGKMPLFRLTGRGDIDLGRRRIDYLAKAALVNTTAGQGGKDLAYLRGISVPVRLYGPFAQPAYRIEFADLGVAAVKERVRERLQGGQPASLGNPLKKLFGR